jgi:hypothetical protein
MSSTKKEKNIYFTDKYVTSILLRDMQKGKVSNELAEIFLKIQDRILKKPNFIGYYSGLKDEMRSEGTYLFLTHWKKFKPYRVKNNYEFVESGNFLVKDGKHKSSILFTNKCFNKYDMLEIDDRTYSVKECEKIDENNFKITLFNKLKNEISKNAKVTYLKPKVDLFDYNSGIITGGFTYLTTFAFTGATNKITHFKKEKQKMKEIIDKYNDNIYLTLQSQKQDISGYIKRDVKEPL